ncbi:MAG TPA: phospholipid carrier-dependent glycosyltransferase [Thermoanaerobaculia bacterium]|nr:phospholipid carrier-dependent glycosyltransferase [Thermoanaerobaculia bacterium]
MTSRERWLLFAALLLLLVPVWLEPAGSWLAEPDEARYAEIPREMLASRDYVTPRLNGIPYFEKPALLYWANAASMRLFGVTPWAARLPTRLFGLGTVMVLVLGTAAAWGAETGLAAGILYLASPYGFLFSRVNLTDAPLTFFFTATLFLARATIARREARLPWKTLSLLTGLAAAGGFLSKGLAAIVLPGGILLLWCLLARRTRFLPTLLAGPALPAFLLASAPWFFLAEKRNPGFLDFFFIHEHFQRFSASGHSRPGPIYYFVPVFLAGFLPAIPFFFSALRRSRLAGDREAQFFLTWFAVVLVFFSVSRSKLPPYLLPAIPAAAALAARSVFARPRAGPGAWLACAILAALLPAAVLIDPTLRGSVREYGLTAVAIGGLGVLLAGSFAAAALSRRSAVSALAALACGWAGLGVMAALGWPKLPNATGPHALASAAVAARNDGATVVGYQAYLQGLPLALAAPIPLADYVGELEPQFLRSAGSRDALLWTREKFWSEWKSGRRYAALIRERDMSEFKGGTVRVLARGPKQFLVANYRERE